MRATVTGIKRSNTTLILEFDLDDTARVPPFHWPSVIEFLPTESNVIVRDRVITRGQEYIRVLDAEEASKAGASPIRVGATVNIPNP